MTINKAIEWSDRAAAFSFWAMIYFLPISTALCESFSGAALFFFFVKRGCIFKRDAGRVTVQHEALSRRIKTYGITFLKSVKPVSSPLSRPIGFFIVACALSICGSEFLGESLKGFFFRVLEWTFLYFIFIECINTKRRLTIFLTVFVASIAVVSVNGLVQYYTGQGFILGRLLVEGRVRSTFRHPNGFGAYLVIASRFLFSLLLACCFMRRPRAGFAQGKNSSLLDKTLVKAILPVVFIVVIICLGLTYSRGAWLGFAGAMLFLSWHERRGVFSALLAVILFFVAFSPPMETVRHVSFTSDDTRVFRPFAVFYPRQSEGLEESRGIDTQPEIRVLTINRLLDVVKNLHGSGRIHFWREALSIIRHYPVFGTGVNTYARMAPRYKITWGAYPHNCYLHMAAEIGLVGLGMFLWVLWSLFQYSMKNLPAITDSGLKAVATGLLAGLLGFCIHSFFDTNLYSVQLGNLMWIVMGAIVATHTITLQQHA